jgi:hypothetical protein
MIKYLTGAPVDLVCETSALPEFPKLLFSNLNADSVYFDATAYLQTKTPSPSAMDFLVQRAAQIQTLQQAYTIEPADVCRLNKDGHILIDVNFVYLFIAFVEPEFLAYVNDRIHELFTNSFCVSDTYLLEMSKKRLPVSVLENAMEEHAKNS